MPECSRRSVVSREQVLEPAELHVFVSSKGLDADSTTLRLRRWCGRLDYCLYWDLNKKTFAFRIQRCTHELIQSSQLVEPLWTDTGQNNGTGVSERELISTRKKREQEMIPGLPPPQKKNPRMREKATNYCGGGGGFSLLARILGECSTIHFPPALFLS